MVARFGEMDVARWWNTDGMLGRHGALALRRGFPATHHFAQARVAFAVARERCGELVGPADFTLFHLPPEIEERFEDAWPGWCSAATAWEPTFARLTEIPGAPTGARDLVPHLADVAGMDEGVTADVDRLAVTAGAQSILVELSGDLDDRVVAMLAAGFALGAPATPVVPYLRGTR